MGMFHWPDTKTTISNQVFAFTFHHLGESNLTSCGLPTRVLIWVTGVYKFIVTLDF